MQEDSMEIDDELYSVAETLSTITVSSEQQQQPQTQTQLNQVDLPEKQEQQNFTLPSNLNSDLNLLVKSPDALKMLGAVLEVLVKMQKEPNSTGPDEVFRAVAFVRKLVSIEQNPPIQQIIDAGLVPHLCVCLKQGNPQNLRFEAAWALTNIASGTSEQTLLVVQSGAVPLFVDILKESDASEALVEQAVWALGNIAGDSTKTRDYILSLGGLKLMIPFLGKQVSANVRRNTAWAVSNCCRGKPQPPLSSVNYILPVIGAHIIDSDPSIVQDLLWALSYISDGENERITAVIKSGVIPHVIKLMNYPTYAVQTPALRIIGNIVTGDDTQTQYAINLGLLPMFTQLLKSPKKTIRKECCWAISNITAGTKTQIQSVIASGLMQPIIEIAKNSEFDIKKEALWAIANLTSSGTDEQIAYIVQLGALTPLVHALKAPDQRVVMVALEGIENILASGEKLMLQSESKINKYAQIIEEAGGIETLEDLQHHANSDIYNKTVTILTKHFGAEESDEEQDQPSQFNFATPNSNAPNSFQF